VKRFLGLLLLGAVACAPRQTVQKESPAATPKPITVFDTIKVETVAVVKEPVITFDETPTQRPPRTPSFSEPSPSSASRVRIAPGYRVQVFATLYRDKAEAFREGIVAKWGVKAYVVEERDPAQGVTLYKVRVGNFLDRASAEAMRDRIRRLWGYTDAFVVQDQVEIDR